MALARAIPVCALLTLLAPAAAAAAEFHLDDRVVSGAWVGEADGVVHVLTIEGERETFDRDEVIWIDWHAPVPEKLEERMPRERERFIRERRKVARKLMRTLERSKEPERPSLMAKFDGFDEAQSLHAYSDGLESKKEFVREFAFERLSGFRSEAAVVPFVRVHITSPDRAFAERAFEQARAMRPELTRQLYEHVAQTGNVDHRVRAVSTLQEIGDPAALPALVRVLHYVDINLRATVARTKQIREVPLDLGSTSQAAQNVTIDLPELEIISVNSTLRIPTVSLRRIEGVTTQALRTISGKSLGNDVGAWANYVRENRATWEGEEKSTESAEDSEG